MKSSISDRMNPLHREANTFLWDFSNWNSLITSFSWFSTCHLICLECSIRNECIWEDQEVMLLLLLLRKIMTYFQSQESSMIPMLSHLPLPRNASEILSDDWGEITYQYPANSNHDLWTHDGVVPRISWLMIPQLLYYFKTVSVYIFLEIVMEEEISTIV
jgi:hypothetical protein